MYKNFFDPRLFIKSEPIDMNNFFYTPLSIWSTTSLEVYAAQSVQVAFTLVGMDIFWTASGCTTKDMKKPALACQAM